MNGSLPEASISVGLKRRAAACATVCAAGTLPVKSTACVPACSIRRRPASGPPPMTCTRPGGRCSNGCIASSAVSVVNSEGLTMIALPAASAAAACQPNSNTG